MTTSNFKPLIDEKEELRKKIKADTDHFLSFKRNKIQIIPRGVQTYNAVAITKEQAEKSKARSEAYKASEKMKASKLKGAKNGGAARVRVLKQKADIQAQREKNSMGGA